MIRPPITVTVSVFKMSKTVSRVRIRRFIVYYDNSKRVVEGETVQHADAEGILFSSGRVILDKHFQGFETLADMERTLLSYGQYRISWIDNE